MQNIKVINLRGLPEPLYKELKLKAAKKGTSLKALIIELLQEGLKEKNVQKTTMKKMEKECFGAWDWFTDEMEKEVKNAYKGWKI